MPNDTPTTDVTLPPAVRADEAAREAAQKAKEGGLSDTTKAQYERRWQRFEAWCEEAGRSSLPASVETACAYLYAYQEDKGVTVGTLRNYSAAIRHKHRAEGLPSPTEEPAFQRFMANRKQEGRARETNSANPLYTEDLKELLRTCDTTAPRGKRDFALLLTGFAGALRRSEIVQIDWGHLREREGGYLLTVPTQKNRDDAQVKGLPATGKWTSPAAAITGWAQWLAGAVEEFGGGTALFQGLTQTGTPTGRMTTQGVYVIVKARCKQAGLDPDAYSPHSLRSGMLTQASEEGASLADITAQSGHKDTDVARSYIDAGKALDNPAVSALGL